MKRCCLLLCCILLSSCLTTIDDVPPYISPLANVLIGDIEKLVAQKNFLQALQLIERMEREKTDVSSEELAILKEKATDGVVALFHASVNEQRYEQAIDLYASVAVIGEGAHLSDWSPGKMLYQLAEQKENAGDHMVALMYYIRALRTEELSGNQIQHVIDLTASMNDTNALQLLVSEMDKRKKPVSREIREKAGRVYPVSTMINGTVTIWVNKGFKIEHGVSMPERVIGSGFFIDRRGYILTNYHVIESEVNPAYEGYSRLFVRLSEKPEQKLPARVVGYDQTFDLALIKVEIEPKFVFSSAQEPEAELGEKLTVIGSPIGLENTITSGIVSAKGRRFLQIGDVLQIDAPVNPGNSGGPVIDAGGRLLGIVFAGLEQFEGINFALGTEWINLVLPRLFAGGQVTHYWTGMAVAAAEEGLELVYVVPGEPGDNAGLRCGDIITNVNGKACRTITQLQRDLEQYQNGALIFVEVVRGAEKFSALVCLTERPRVPIRTALERDSRSNVFFPLFGMKIEKVTDSASIANYMVRRVLPGSIAEEYGFSENDTLDIRGWYVDYESSIIGVEVKVQRRKLGFLETFFPMFSYLEIDSFI